MELLVARLQMERTSLLLIALCASILCGCIHHDISKDYNQYLLNNRGAAGFESVDSDARYVLTERTKEHRTAIKSGMAGIGNRWEVELGKMLETTLASSEVMSALGLRSDESAPNVLTFDLESYEFKHHGAHVSLNVTYAKGEKEVLRKTYNASGIRQTGKMVWGGAFGMKNAIQQSTKAALDEILKTLISDLKGLEGTRRVESEVSTPIKSVSSAASGGEAKKSCTADQILKMVQMGMAESQIKAACR